jgi:hypothetical protein
VTPSPYRTAWVSVRDRRSFGGPLDINFVPEGWH